MSTTDHTREAHGHAPGIWCDECPDADVKRMERLLVDHCEIDVRELIMSDCACGWTNPLNGTGYAYRKHVASVLAAHVAAVVEASQEHAGAEWSALRIEVEQLRERLDLVTCEVCDDLMIPSEDVLPTKDSWVHRDCAEAGE